MSFGSEMYSGMAVYGRVRAVVGAIVGVLIALLLAAAAVAAWRHPQKNNKWWAPYALAIGAVAVGAGSVGTAYAALVSKGAAAAVGTVDFAGDLAQAL